MVISSVKSFILSINILSMLEKYNAHALQSDGARLMRALKSAHMKVKMLVQMFREDNIAISLYVMATENVIELILTKSRKCYSKL